MSAFGKFLIKLLYRMRLRSLTFLVHCVVTVGLSGLGLVRRAGDWAGSTPFAVLVVLRCHFVEA